MSGCPDPSVLEAFRRGTLSPHARTELELHLDACRECATTVAELARLYGSASWGVSVADSAEAPLSVPSAGLRDTVYAVASAGFEPASSPVVVGRYQLGRRLGAGGMGMVFEGHDPELHRLVAIKLLHPGVTEQAEVTRARLLREARAMARLAHPNVVAVHDVGGVGEQVFVAMELVHGTTLAQWVRAARRSQRQIVAVFVQAGRGLEAAHAVGLVHRDFKPDNVLIGADGRARVTDFGLARPSLSWPMSEVQATDPALAGAFGVTTRGPTAHGAIVGTPAYMAPEQWRGASADARSDQFSFCVALYEAAFGQRPFAGDTLVELATNVTAGRMLAVPRSAPGWLRAVIGRGLARDPDDRHPSMTALLEALERDRGRIVRVSAVASAMVVGAMATVGVLAWMSDSTAALPSADAGPGDVAVSMQEGATDPGEAGAASTVVRDTAACRERARTADGRWTPERRTELRDRVARMERGPDLAAQVIPVLDGWVEDYANRAAASCEGAAEAPHAEASRRCLQHGLRRFEALVGRALELEPFRIHGSLAGAAYRLPRLESCSNEAWLAVAPGAPPVDLSARVALLSDELAAVEADAWLEQLVSAPLAAERLVDTVEALGHAPLLAEAQLATGLVAACRLQSDIAGSWLEPAAETAQSAGHEWVLARAAIALVEQQGAQRLRFAEAERWERVASAASARLGDAELGAALSLASGRLLHAKGELRGAMVALNGAVAPHREVFGDVHPKVAAVHLAISNVALELGDSSSARAHAESARTMLVDTVGPGDLQTARAEAALARALLGAGELAPAEEAIRRAVKIVPVSSSLLHDYDRGRYVLLLGDVLAARGAHDEALAEYERAKIYLYDGAPRSEPSLAIGALLVRLGRNGEGLRVLGEALAQLEEDHGVDDPRLLDALRVIGGAQLQAGAIVAARVTLERGVVLADSAMGFGPRLSAMQIALAEVERAAGDDVRALELLDDAHVAWVGAHDLGHPEVTRTVLARADLAWGLGQHEYAARLYGTVAGELEARLGAGAPATARARGRAGE